MIKLRANKVVIETPKEGAEPWIHVFVQRVEKNGDIYNVVDRWDNFNKRMSVVQTELMPVLNDYSSGYMAVGHLGQQIALIVSMWLVERYGGNIDPETGDVVIES